MLGPARRSTTCGKPAGSSSPPAAAAAIFSLVPGEPGWRPSTGRTIVLKVEDCHAAVSDGAAAFPVKIPGCFPGYVPPQNAMADT